ncbi:IS30 family transposase [Rhizobium aquaticum]|uniref:IS30 family transposase n=1 Tax=Rhizobium aquaticum TaxID=1549636 RepID=A0ABV2J5C8_9HYPH
MKTRYSHLTLADRRQIERWRLMKMSATEIAERLGRHRSTVFRPDVVAGRREFGHWEADLVHFRQKFGPANVTTMVERLSRFLVVLRNPEKRTKPIMSQIAEVLRALPLTARRSVTFDRSSEFIDWPKSIGEVSIDGLIGFVPHPIRREPGAAPHCR